MIDYVNLLCYYIKKSGGKMFLKKEKKTTTEIVNEIQNEVYKYLKPLGFRKHGRAFCRFVDGDIAQVIEFQVGLALKGDNHCLWVNVGIRIPECEERTFDKEISMKKFFHEYQCNLRSRLGSIVDGKDTYYDLRRRYDKYARDIIKRLEEYVIPVFDILNSRENILDHRRDYPKFDTLNSHLILLEESMIYGRRGDIEKASELFIAYYQKAINENEEQRKHILKVGVPIKNSGYYKMPDGHLAFLPVENKGHIAYLQDLANKLNITL